MSDEHDGKPPSFPFYVRDFATDPRVLVMTCEEVGGYVMLLCAAWLQPEPGVLPNDDETLAALSRLRERWPDCRKRILAAFVVDGERLIQKRMVAVREAQRRYYRGQKARGKAGANARWHKPVDGDGIGSPLLEQSLPMALPLPLPLPLQENKNQTKNTSPAAPAGFDLFWAAWPTGHRVGKGAAETKLRQALKHATLEQIIAGVERAKLTERWRKGFIQNPATWLHQRGWEDDARPADPKGADALREFTRGED